MSVSGGLLSAFSRRVVSLALANGAGFIYAGSMPTRFFRRLWARLRGRGEYLLELS